MPKWFKPTLFIVCILSMMVTPAIFGQWWLFSVFAVFFVIFGIIEFCAWKFTGKTISQKFWKLSQDTPWKAWVIVGSMILGWVALIWHLLEKIGG